MARLKKDKKTPVIDYEYVFFGRHKSHRAAKIFTIAVLAAALFSVAVYMQTTKTEPKKDYLATDYFGDDGEFKGLTLPFPEGTKYNMTWNPYTPLMTDFAVKEGTLLLAAAPGKVRSIDKVKTTDGKDAVQIRITYTKDTYLIYVLGNTPLDITVNQTIKRGHRIAALGEKIHTLGTSYPASVGIQISGSRQKELNEQKFYWAAGEPKYYRE